MYDVVTCVFADSKLTIINIGIHVDIMHFSGYNYTSANYVFNLLACYAFEYCTPA